MAEIGGHPWFDSEHIQDTCEYTVSLDPESLGDSHEKRENLKKEIDLNFFLVDTIHISEQDLLPWLDSLQSILYKLSNKKDLTQIIEGKNECKDMLEDIENKIWEYIVILQDIEPRVSSDSQKYAIFTLTQKLEWLLFSIQWKKSNISLHAWFEPKTDEDFSKLIQIATWELVLHEKSISRYLNTEELQIQIKELPKLLRDPEYISGLKLLHSLGVSPEWIIALISSKEGKELMSDQAKIREVIKVLESLFWTQNIIFNIALFNNPKIREKLASQEVIEWLQYLAQNSLKINSSTILEITPRQAQDRDYLDAFLRLRKQGIYVTVQRFTIEMSHDVDFINAVIKLESEGIRVWFDLGKLFWKKHKSNIYVWNMIYLHNIASRRIDIENIDLTKWESRKYLSNILDLCHYINEKYPSYFFRDVDIVKWESDIYISNLKKLHDAWVPVNTYTIKNLSLEKGGNSGFIDAIIQLHNSWIDSIDDVMSLLSLEKGLSREYIDYIIYHKDQWYPLSWYDIGQFDIFHATDPLYRRLMQEEMDLDSNSSSIMSLSIKVQDKYLEASYWNDSLISNVVEHMPGTVLWNWAKLSTTPEWQDILMQAGPKMTYISLALVRQDSEDWKKTTFLHKFAEMIVLEMLAKIRNGELKDKRFALHVVRSTDQLHEMWDLRYRIIDTLNPSEMYDLIHYGREEIFTSSYNGILDRLLIKLTAEWKSIYDLVVTEKGFEWFGVFLEASVSYNRFTDMFNTIKDSSKKQELLRKYIEHIIEKQELEDAVALAEAMQKIQDPDILQQLEEMIIATYKDSSPEVQILLGLVGKSYAPKTENTWFHDLPEKYQLPNLQRVRSEELFDESGRNVQQYFFYNDPDGIGSFDNFISGYKKDPKWKIQDHGQYITITREDQKSGKSIVLYANKAQSDEAGVGEVKKVIEALNPPVKSLNVVHRGHSYHADKTISRMTSTAKLAFLGSCGWYQNFWQVLEKSPYSHIIATKWIGTRHVNDPLFKIINDTIISWEDIVWSRVWEQIEPKVSWNKNWKNYIRPDQNFGAMFIQKYNELSEE